MVVCNGFYDVRLMGCRYSLVVVTGCLTSGSMMRCNVFDDVANDSDVIGLFDTGVCSVVDRIVCALLSTVKRWCVLNYG